MQSKIINRILSEAGVPRLFPTLSQELSLSDLQSLLLSVYKSRVQAIDESQVLTRMQQNALFLASNIDARIFNDFDRTAFECADGFEAVELSPVCPLGAAFVLGRVDQDHVLTGLRNAEALGDSTTAMALECARRRKSSSGRQASPTIRLCSSHRLIRLQPINSPGLTPHFRLFALVSAGRDTGSHSFETQHLGEHIRIYLTLLRALNTRGFAFRSPLVEISDLTMTDALLTEAGATREQVRSMVRPHRPGSSQRFLQQRGIRLPDAIVNPRVELEDIAQRFGLGMQLIRLNLIKQRIIDPIQTEYPEACFRFNLARLEGLGYYTGLCLRISPAAPDGSRHGIIDGGFTDWTARLLHDKKERLLTSGIGSEFACRRFRESS